MDVILIVLGCAFAFVLIFSLIVFLLVFYSASRGERVDGVYSVPKGEIYEPYHDKMREWARLSREIPHEKVSVISYDGLKLCGRYYSFFENAPIELMIHGYRGDSERDLAGGVFRAKSVGHNVLLIDQRASGESEGHIITFGIKEHRDCLTWIDYIVNKIDKDAKIILTGVSMGAATVLVTAGCELPQNVVGVLADCGYTSPEAIIKDVVRKIHLPSFIFYPFIALGARIYGGFSLKEKSPIEAMKAAKLPIIFFHGDNDAFVPHEMSVENYNACASEKKHLVITKGAGHGLCYVIDKDGYVRELKNFFNFSKETSYDQ